MVKKLYKLDNQQPSPEQGKVQRLLCTLKWVEAGDGNKRKLLFAKDIV